MEHPLESKVALVTGASKGVGKGIALELARAGANVAVNYNEVAGLTFGKDVIVEF